MFANSGRYDTNVYGTLLILELEVLMVMTVSSYSLRIMMTAFIKSPKKLNRYYEFTVSVTDGDTIQKRDFKFIL